MSVAKWKKEQHEQRVLEVLEDDSPEAGGGALAGFILPVMNMMQFGMDINDRFSVDWGGWKLVDARRSTHHMGEKTRPALTLVMEHEESGELFELRVRTRARRMSSKLK